MKPMKVLSLLGLLFVFGACENNRNTEAEAVVVEEPVSPDVVIERWSEAWNNNDTEVLQDMTADDVVLLMNGREVPRDSVGPWMVYSSSNMQNLQSTSLYKGAQGDVAYDSGTFSHTFADDTTGFNGSYTFIWERGETEDDWKVKVMHIADTGERDTLNDNQ